MLFDLFKNTIAWIFMILIFCAGLFVGYNVGYVHCYLKQKFAIKRILPFEIEPISDEYLQEKVEPDA